LYNEGISDNVAFIPRIKQYNDSNPIIESLSKNKKYKRLKIDSLTRLFSTINKFTIRINKERTSTDDPNTVFAVINRDSEDVRLTFKKDGKKLNNGEISEENTVETIRVPLTRRENIYRVSDFTNFLGTYFKSKIEYSDDIRSMVRSP